MKIQVNHVDFIGKKIGQMRKTDEGYLTGKAPIAKVGIMSYLLNDGSIIKEFVSKDTLFEVDSMESLKMKPVTDTHPLERTLDSKSVKRRKVGFTGETINKEDNFLTTSMVITDDDTIHNINDGRQELSPGYTCELDMSPGEFNGEHYDAIQLKRRYNHVAICDKARGGDELKLHLDSKEIDNLGGFEINDAVLTSAKRKALPDSSFCFVKGTGKNKVRKFPVYDAAHVRNALARLPQSNLTANEKSSVLTCLKRKAKSFGVKVSEDHLDFNIDDYNLTENEKFIIQRKEKTMPIFKIDGIEYEAAQEVINHITKLDADYIASSTELQKERDKETVRADTAEGERDTYKTKIDELGEVDTFAEIVKGVKERSKILDVAKVVLDKEEFEKLDNVTNDEMKKLIIKKKNPDINLDEKAEAYIEGMFDTIISTMDNSSIANQRKDAAIRNDGSLETDLEKIKKDAETLLLNSYKDFGKDK